MDGMMGYGYISRTQYDLHAVRCQAILLASGQVIVLHMKLAPNPPFTLKISIDLLTSLDADTIAEL